MHLTNKQRAWRQAKLICTFVACICTKKLFSQSDQYLVGPLWRYTECETSDVMPAEGCLTHVRKHCISKTHLVTKILRTTLDNYENVLTKHESVVLIQLFRDPRAIINSRSRTWWYSYASDKALEDDADCLCSRMMLDYEYGLAFQAKFPARMLFLISASRVMTF